MKVTILASRRQRAVEKLAGLAAQLSPETPLSFANLPKGNAEHRQLFMLETMADFLEALPQENGITLDDILAIDGLSKTSIKAIEAHFGNQ